MSKNYLTIKKSGSDTLIEKKSAFICQIARITNEEEALTFIASVRKLEPKARHHCFAYTFNLDSEVQRQSDDGEPSGTAGVPILEVIKAKQLKNICIVVSRKFGGIKLGTGGLIRAYSNAASQTIDAIGVVERILQTELICQVAYQNVGKLENYLEKNNIIIQQVTYLESVSFTLAVDQKELTTLQDHLIDLLNNQVTFKLGQNLYNELSIQ
ncbi:YigZ family protein [Dellaglioa algida]|uniref:YigZ family protein n=1 Tax=Dellaglioa algida TaxID=105612 RepID=A0A5C6ME10_9LACO|nr:YigZ family protein [Dellaglioa algida]MDK1717151.1 YigZ family protein [Dellaglioa algida]MDK1720346.1 YigZ family protein [Dellaglioa algida]MDK1722093.1 YigZ family protein [Dellaglioa algida]MDK1723789.1 YigZ family protein [Dellaglioa algida]MDK1725370.1 YigZ family protein [Dellaglioa algida]